MPRPGTPVIHAAWSEHHRPVAVATMTARCTIDRPGDGAGTYNPEDGTTTPSVRVALYEDLPCRVQQQPQPQEAATAGQEVTTHDYLVAVPITATDLEVGQQVLITANPDDASLVDRRLTVTDVMRGSLVWQRDLICVDHLG